MVFARKSIFQTKIVLFLDTLGFTYNDPQSSDQTIIKKGIATSLSPLRCTQESDKTTLATFHIKDAVLQKNPNMPL